MSFFRRRSQPDASLVQLRRCFATFEQLPEVANAPWYKKQQQQQQLQQHVAITDSADSSTKADSNTKAAAPKANTHHWAKGTGYGNASRDTTSSWDINTWITSRKANLEKTREACVNLLQAMQQVSSKGLMEQVAKEEKFELLLFFLRDELRVDSISEVERDSKKYEMAFKLLEAVISHDTTAASLLTTEQLPLYDNISLLATQAEMIQRFEKTLESKIGDVATSSAKASKKPTPAKPKSDDDNAFSIVVERIVSMSNKLKQLKAKIQVRQEELQKSGDENIIGEKKCDDCSVDGETKQVEPQLRQLTLVEGEVKPEMKIADQTSLQAAALANLQATTTTTTTTTTITISASNQDSSHIPQSPPVLMTAQSSVVDAVSAVTTVALIHINNIPIAPPVLAGNIPIAPPVLADNTPIAPIAPVVPAEVSIEAWTPEEKKLQLEKDDQYMKEMRSLQFGEVSSFNYHKYSANNIVVTRPWIKRVTAEYADLSRSLPLTACSSVFMRVHEEKMGMVQFMIAAPEDTPYAGGLFLFDVFLPTEYPNKPPLCNLQTTGKGTVRFNPNLYNCGKVCLSLLGTWNGDQSESWNAQTSTLLQLAVSLQSLIFVPEPYFNEPGYERQIGTEGGRASSDNYNRNIEQQAVRWAMIDMLKNPPKGFEEVVKKHFTLRKSAILQECRKWLSKPQREGLKELVRELRQQLDAL